MWLDPVELTPTPPRWLPWFYLSRPSTLIVEINVGALLGLEPMKRCDKIPDLSKELDVLKCR
jgi:hypothetical protein